MQPGPEDKQCLGENLNPLFTFVCRYFNCFISIFWNCFLQAQAAKVEKTKMKNIMKKERKTIRTIIKVMLSDKTRHSYHGHGKHYRYKGKLASSCLERC